ncbi:hypothetical protein NUW54_g12999 [Trametes sanguinea]|uniref:Uncharacterized protein n=1 Tax=Trametes sanguinea TaxID=158606 RepID=A0ACC1MSG6_9APHY|nr:hypothetical protein NUW54_g12999 [Trametes sanguinea]
MTGSTLRPPETLTQLSPDDPRRTSVDLYSSFHLQMQSVDMSFDLLNDKISFLGNGQDSFWAGGESGDDTMFEFDEENRVPAMEKRRLSLSEGQDAFASLPHVHTPPARKAQSEQSSVVRSPTEEAAKVPLPMSPPSPAPSPRVTPSRGSQVFVPEEPSSPPSFRARAPSPSHTTRRLHRLPVAPELPQHRRRGSIAGFNSPNCGSCWKLTYAGTGKSINVLAIDHAGAGFNIALEAMNTLTNNQGVFLGRIDATATQVDDSECGL